MQIHIKELKRSQLFYVDDPEDSFKVYSDPTQENGVWSVEATGGGDEAVTLTGDQFVTLVPYRSAI